MENYFQGWRTGTRQDSSLATRSVVCGLVAAATLPGHLLEMQILAHRDPLNQSAFEQDPQAILMCVKVWNALAWGTSSQTGQHPRNTWGVLETTDACVPPLEGLN